MRVSSVARLVAGYAFLALAWSVAIPPFSAPDESSHYLRAIGIAHGRVLGAPVEVFRDTTLESRQEAWVAQTVRWTEVPGGMAADGYACNAFRPRVSAACAAAVPPPPAYAVRRLTLNGTYQPAPYLLPALVMRVARSPLPALFLGRLMNAITCVVLLAIAARALSPHLIGLMLAVTPMVIFIASSLNPSGPEIAGSIALAAGLLGLARTQNGSGCWLAVRSGGVALCLSRSVGPAWLAIHIVVWAVLIGTAELRRILREAPREVAWSSAVICSAVVLNCAWEIKYGPRLPLRTEAVSQALFASLPDLPRWLHGEIGIFQYLDSVMPPVTYLLWTALLLGLVAVAFWLGDGRQRTALLMAVGAAIGVPVVLQAFAMRPIGWGVQGRHVLPVGVLVPLVANEVAVRRGRVLRLPSAPVAVVCSFVYFVGFYSDARRSAIGYGGSWLFPLHPQWSPPLGWWPWIFCAICGAALLGRARLESLVEVSGWTTE